MTWHPADLPQTTQNLFNKHIHAPILWPSVVKDAIEQGEHDADVLANIVFYMHHPDLIGTALAPSMANFKNLAAEWTGWRNFVKPMVKVLEKPATKTKPKSSWEHYNDAFWSKNSFLPQAAKDWMAEKPTHRREAAVFKTSIVDHGRELLFFAWKTTDPASFCLGAKAGVSGVLDTWMERKTSLSAIKADHKLKTDWISILGNDSGGKGIAAMNIGMNKLMFYYVIRNGIWPAHAKTRAKSDLHKEGKQILSLVKSVVGGASGAKAGGPKTLPSRSEAPVNLSKIGWKGFIETVYKTANGDYGKSPDVKRLTSGLSVSRVIKNSSGDVIGAVRHFD